MTLIFEWLSREGWMVFNWWLMATLAGAVAAPLCARLLHALPDRGYAFYRPLGLILVGWTLWMLTTVKLLRNTPVGIALAWGIVLSVSLLVYFREKPTFDWRAWWREHRAGMITVEVIFALVLLGWSIFRATQNEIFTGEKPMDGAMMSAIMQTQTFPPEDPWASGYPISYYHFTYLIGAMHSLAANTSNTTGYNLWAAMIFALTAQATFGIGYNLVRSRYLSHTPPPDSLPVYRAGEKVGKPMRGKRAAVLIGLLTMLLVTMTGNYEFALVELPFQTGTASPQWLAFWDVRERGFVRNFGDDPAHERTLWGWSYQWWFTPSRVLRDRVIYGTYHDDATDAINEFPLFSYLFSDNHPHVAALAFSMALAGVALNILLSPRPPDMRSTVFYGLLIGALIFMNTWDMPIYLALAVGAEVLRRLRCGIAHWSWRDLRETAAFGAGLLIVGIIAYAPYLATFQSSASAMLPNLYQPIRLRQMFLIFGPIMLPAAWFLGYEALRAAREGRFAWRRGLLLTLVIVSGLAALTIVFSARDLSGEMPYYSVVNALRRLPDINAVVPEMVQYRLDGTLSLLVLMTGLTAVIGLLLPRVSQLPPTTAYAVLLIGLAVGLVLVPEFIYLGDITGVRVNTVFKFYFQAWALGGIGAAYGIFTLLADPERRISAQRKRQVLAFACFVVVGLGAMYLPPAVYARTVRERWYTTGKMELEGGSTLVTPPDFKILKCLQAHVGQRDVTVASGVYKFNDSYNLFYEGNGLGSGRVGPVTGIPTVLGWGRHQIVWRGEAGFDVIGTRAEDLRTLYTTPDLEVARAILTRYSIDYIVYGEVERHPDWYGTEGEAKFLEAKYPVICQEGEAKVFEVPQPQR